MNIFKIFKTKPTIICIHGFGKRRTAEFDILISKLAKKYNFVCPDLFDPSNDNDDKWEDWVLRASEVIKKEAKNKKIYLLGYSMGGVIVSHLSNLPNVEKLILIAPAFDYINISNVISTINKVINTNKPKVISGDNYVELPRNFTQTFMDLVDNLKTSVSTVNVPVLLIHGSEDRIISPNSSIKYFNKM